MEFTVGSADDTPPQIAVYNEGRGASVPPANTLVSAPWLIGLSTPAFSFSDSGSGLGWFALYDDESGELLSWEFYDGAPSATADIYLPKDKAGYNLVVADEADNQSSLYFHVDRHEPEVEYSTVSVNLNGGYYSVDAAGSAKDDTAGIGAGPVMLVNPPEHGDLGVHPAGDKYPPGPMLSTFSYTSLTGGGHTEYMFLAADKADNLGENELWLEDLDQTAEITESGPWYTEYLNNGLEFPDNIKVVLLELQCIPMTMSLLTS